MMDYVDLAFLFPEVRAVRIKSFWRSTVPSYVYKGVNVAFILYLAGGVEVDDVITALNEISNQSHDFRIIEGSSE